MNLQEIERLIGKYYDGNTTLEEERRLKDFFAQEKVPPQFQAEKLYFAMLSGEKARNLPDDGLETAVMDKVAKEGLLVRLMARRQWFYASVGVAASVLILLAIFIKFDPFPKRLQDTYTDPQQAYLEAKKVLLFVSGKFNEGADKLQPLKTYDDGLSELKTFQALDDGINAVGKIRKYNKIEQMTNNSK